MIFRFKHEKPSAVNPEATWGRPGVDPGSNWGQNAPPYLGDEEAVEEEAGEPHVEERQHAQQRIGERYREQLPDARAWRVLLATSLGAF